SQLAESVKLPDGSVVSAKHQTSGKGQWGNVWQSEENQNFTFSIIYFPGNIHLNRQFLLTQAISLGVFDYLSSICKKVKIKWPNDLYVSNHKIGGLLIENSIKGEFISQTIIGVGLNINQKEFNIANNKITSLSIENNEKYNLNEELNKLLTSIERRYLQWKGAQFALIKSNYLEVLYLHQSWHIYQTKDGNYLDGKIIGTNEIGQLLLEDLNGNIHTFGNKEIKF
ncbi:MAG TPA: biotin--[acetyl-CoA-carboxylase] ligase, partial [Bacteroidia bacterium]|nr:biotin--[acetyl-CoA-carboxylase] ligase [Bacteroidia bacterium]